jgi:hypothetical protein
MIPGKTVDRVTNHLINALVELKGWSISQHHYDNIKDIVNNIQIQLDCAVEAENTDANVSL